MTSGSQKTDMADNRFTKDRHGRQQVHKRQTWLTTGSQKTDMADTRFTKDRHGLFNRFSGKCAPGGRRAAAVRCARPGPAG